MKEHNIIKVKQEHIRPGIEKYGGRVDEELKKHLAQARLEYIPYLFKDGRVMLVLEIMNVAFLYPSRETVYEVLLSE